MSSQRSLKIFPTEPQYIRILKEATRGKFCRAKFKLIIRTAHLRKCFSRKTKKQTTMIDGINLFQLLRNNLKISIRSQTNYIFKRHLIKSKISGSNMQMNRVIFPFNLDFKFSLSRFFAVVLGRRFILHQHYSPANTALRVTVGIACARNIGPRARLFGNPGAATGGAVEVICLGRASV